MQRTDAIVHRKNLGLVERFFELSEPPGKLVQWHGIVIWPDLQGINGHVGEDAGNFSSLIIEHSLRACRRPLADKYDTALAYRTVDGILRFGAYRGRHFASRPPAGEGAFKHCANGTRLPRDLGVCCALGFAAQDHHEDEQTAENTRNDPEGERYRTTARKQDSEEYGNQNGYNESESHPPNGGRIVPSGHCEDLVHLLETTRLLLRLGG